MHLRVLPDKSLQRERDADRCQAEQCDHGNRAARLRQLLIVCHGHKKALQIKLSDCKRKVNESAMRDCSSEILRRTLQDFRTAFATFHPAEPSEALQCVLKRVMVHPGKLALEIFELEELCPSSQKRKDWLPGLDSN
jgi:hypothetical protein